LADAFAAHPERASGGRNRAVCHDNFGFDSAPFMGFSAHVVIPQIPNLVITSIPKMEKVFDPKKYIEQAMHETGLDVATFSEALGYSLRTVKRWISGELKLSSLAIGQVEKLVAGGIHPLSKNGISSAILREEAAEYKAAQKGAGIFSGVRGDARKMAVRRVPVIGWAQAGEAVAFEDVVDWDAVVSVETSDPKSIAIRVKGDSMTPLIAEGDIVVVSPSDQPVNEKYVVAKLAGDGVVCKQFRRLSPARYELRSMNQFYQPLIVEVTDVVWIYPVTQLIKKL
jgi:SOS-response transcriptional repressor LexA